MEINSFAINAYAGKQGIFEKIEVIHNVSFFKIKIKNQNLKKRNVYDYAYVQKASDLTIIENPDETEYKDTKF